jgi:hypothetical protein
MQYKKRCRPRLDTLRNIAAEIGCRAADFFDNPSDSPPNLQDHWSSLSESERAIASSLLADISAGDLSLEEKEALYGIFKEAKKALLKLKK